MTSLTNKIIDGVGYTLAIGGVFDMGYFTYKITKDIFVQHPTPSDIFNYGIYFVGGLIVSGIGAGILERKKRS